MRYLILAAAAAIVTASLPAYAGTNATTATNGTTGSSQMSSANQATEPGNPNATPWDLKSKDVTAARSASRELRNELQQAGFTDVHIMPQSFLVRAKNKEGMQVMMVVNPDSITAVTAMTETPNGSNGNSNAGNDNSATKMGANEGQKTAVGSAKMQGTNEPSGVNPAGKTANSAANSSGSPSSKTE